MNAQQWANIDDDEGALHALLSRVNDYLAVNFIDYLWIFPPRRVAGGESIVVVVAAFDDQTARRRVITAHFTIARDRKGHAFVDACFDEHGSAPDHAVRRIIDGVLHRLGDDLAQLPHEHPIGGDVDRWNDLVRQLAGPTRAGHPPLDEATAPDTPEHAFPIGSSHSDTSAPHNRSV